MTVSAAVVEEATAARMGLISPAFRTNLAVGLMLAASAVVAFASVDLYRRRVQHTKVAAAWASTAAAADANVEFWLAARTPLIDELEGVIPPPLPPARRTVIRVQV